MRAEIKELHQRLRTTTVFVTHDQIEAMTMADKIVVMNAGRIEQVGAPLELYDRPVNLFVAEFIGSPAMNLIRGVARGGGVEAQGTLLPAAIAGAAGGGRPVVYGIRPEHLELADDGLAGARCGWSSRPAPRPWRTCSCGGQEVVAVFRDRARPQARPGGASAAPRRQGASLRSRKRTEASSREASRRERVGLRRRRIFAADAYRCGWC